MRACVCVWAVRCWLDLELFRDSCAFLCEAEAGRCCFTLAWQASLASVKEELSAYVSNVESFKREVDRLKAQIAETGALRASLRPTVLTARLANGPTLLR